MSDVGVSRIVGIDCRLECPQVRVWIIDRLQRYCLAQGVATSVGYQQIDVKWSNVCWHAEELVVLNLAVVGAIFNGYLNR